MKIFQNILATIQEKRKRNQALKVLLKEREEHHRLVLKYEKSRRNEERVAPEGAYISLRNINKIYPNHVQAVYDFNLDIYQNEFIVFVGPSGCGKSTTLRMIAGLENITSGDLFIDGEYVNEDEPKDRNISMVFQSYALYPHMSVYENMAFGLRVNHVNSKIIDEKIRLVADILQIGEYLDRKPNALSGGQCQRVALGRAICKDAKVFLMDEPLSNLDAKLRVQMRTEIVKLHERLKTTTIYVTHDQTEAMTMATRIVVMNKGYIQQIGTPSEIYNYPSNVFVATFVGSPAMNLIDVDYLHNKVYFNDDMSLEIIEKDLDLKIKMFYEEQVKRYADEVTKWKDTFLTRESKKKAYIKLFDNLSNENLQKYLNSIDNNEVKENILKLDIAASSFKEEFNKVIREYLYAFNLEINSELKQLNDTLVALENEVTKDEHKLIFGIRPEDIQRINDDIKYNGTKFDLEVSVSELLGAEYFAHLVFNKQEIIAKLDTSLAIGKGDTISVYFKPNKIRLFDPITKNRIL